MESMIPLLLTHADIHPSCINRDIMKGPAAPLLVLTDHGKEKDNLIICGGNHRLAAVRRLLDELDNQSKVLKKHETILAKELQKQGVKGEQGKAAAVAVGTTKGKGEGKGKGKHKGQQKAEESASDTEGETSGVDDHDNNNGNDNYNTIIAASSLKGIKAQLDDIMNRKAYFSTWGVIIYDAGT
jgi:hypothetical protein